MRRQFSFAALLIVLTASALAASDAGAKRWAIVYLREPTLIGSTIVQGPVIFTHDAGRMAKGEPCTTVQLFEPGAGPVEEIAAFHCVSRTASAPRRFTIRTRPNHELGYGCVLVEYQFAGDTEAHGVPTPAEGH